MSTTSGTDGHSSIHSSPREISPHNARQPSRASSLGTPPSLLQAEVAPLSLPLDMAPPNYYSDVASTPHSQYPIYQQPKSLETSAYHLPPNLMLQYQNVQSDLYQLRAPEGISISQANQEWNIYNDQQQRQMVARQHYQQYHPPPNHMQHHVSHSNQ